MRRDDQSISTGSPAKARTGRRAFLASSAGFAGAALAGVGGLGAVASARPARGRAMRPARRGAAGLAGSGLFRWEARGKGVFASAGEPTTGGNSLVVVGGDASLLVDSKFASLSPLLREEAEGLGAAPLKYLVNTHHHADHSGGNQAFGEGVEIVAYGPATERIRGQHERYLGQLRGAANQVAQAGGTEAQRARALELAEPFVESPPAAGAWVPTRTLRDPSTTLQLGGLSVELRHMGLNAHTDNDLVVFVPERNVLHTGDLVFHGLHPFFDPSANCSCIGWIATLSKLMGMCDGETAVVPGHGAMGDRRVIEGQIAYLAQLHEAVGREVRRGTPKEEVQSMSWAFMDGLGFEQIRGRAIGAVYDEIAGG